MKIIYLYFASRYSVIPLYRMISFITFFVVLEQVAAIKNYKWSNLICDGSEINVVPKDSFKRVSR